MRLRLPWKTKNRLLQEEIEFLRAGYAQLQNYVLMTGGGVTGAAPGLSPIAQSAKLADWGEKGDAAIKDIRTEAQRLYSTELEEDVEFQLQEGLIGEEEAKRLLREADALANDIEAY